MLLGDSYSTICATQEGKNPTVYLTSENCENVFDKCQQGDVPWTRCYEDRIASCRLRSRRMINFIHRRVSWTQEAEESPTPQHKVQISSSALWRSKGADSEDEVLLVATVINSTYFKLSPRPRGRHFTLDRQSTVLGGLVLVVRVGNHPVQNLSQAIKLTFKHNKQVEDGACMFWQESPLEDGTGYWSTVGCETSDTGSEFVCSCNHLSFFAVLVNPVLSVEESHAVNLSYITYIGSALTIFFSVISLIIYICLQRRRPEKAIGVHLQLTGAMLCLHLSFLLCCFWVWQLNGKEEDWVCRGLGLFLHWSLLATFSWMALEGFHLYLLLVQVFNIYVRRYLLKLSLVGWGLPTLIAVVCGISGVYGKYRPESRDANNHSSTAEICWMSSHRLSVSYVTIVAFPCLVILCNSCMLGLVVFKLWRLRTGSRGGSSKKMNREKWMKLWRDCATVLGLSFVLGLPWGLASTTYVSLAGIYVFTVLNSLQGVFMFLWSVAISCKSRSDNNSSTRDPSTQKVMITSFNN
ncbi:adhesion G-protein coupled receptor G1-like isoform X1 [Pseudoliparis swirei]|uniref:adhesion G-protein coupled receptor G1-like isoform X1 n=1 Tax=Pseudoliparis swirei TaxID=2059687 RepID=UPI0024BEF40E|nr:adhesion G-protein coupled receptor G1-like isoform X1 [Pseudoliparis swirei]